jgi:hypothetical protein
MVASPPQRVRDRAVGRCEYCHLPQAASNIPFEIDHITARKHHGRTAAGRELPGDHPHAPSRRRTRGEAAHRARVQLC